jgi:hypothetical protein
MSKYLIHMLVLTNAMLLAFPPSWCCMVRFPRAAEEKAQSCCQKKANPCGSKEKQPEPRSTDDCCCRIDATLPPHAEVASNRLDDLGLIVGFVDLEACSLFDVGQEAAVEIIPSPPLRICHCVWLC